MSPIECGESLTAELIYGLSLHIRRCQSIIGAQVYRSMFYLFKMDSYIDTEIVSALSDQAEKEELVADWYRTQCKNMERWQRKTDFQP